MYIPAEMEAKNTRAAAQIDNSPGVFGYVWNNRTNRANRDVPAGEGAYLSAFSSTRSSAVSLMHSIGHLRSSQWSFTINGCSNACMVYTSNIVNYNDYTEWLFANMLTIAISSNLRSNPVTI